MITLLRALPILMLCFNGTYSNRPLLKDVNYRAGTKWFKCTADGNPGDLISFYQMKDSGSKPVLLHRMQQTTNSSRMNVALQWTLGPSDNRSIIYCAKQSIISSEGKLSEEVKSNSIGPITFHKPKNLTETPYVTVTPDASLTSTIFDTNVNLTFICRGSETVDGRELTWYIQEPSTELKLAISQTFNSTANINYLELRLDETYHCKKLFCAQDFHLIRIPTDDGTVVIDKYRELARSNTTLLRMKGKEDCDMEEGNSDEDRIDGERRPRIGEINTAHGNDVERAVRDSPAASTSVVPMVAVVPIVMVLLLLIIAAILFRCRRRTEIDTQTNNSPDEIDITCSPVPEASNAKISEFPASVSTEKQRSTEVVYATLVIPPPTTGTEAELKIDAKVPTEVTYAALEFSAHLKKDSCAYAPVTVPPADLRQQADLAQPKQAK